MTNDPGLLKIGIPTGAGTNGIRKEILAVTKSLLKELSSGPVHIKYCKYFVSIDEDNVNYRSYHHPLTNQWYDYKWGNVLIVNVHNLELAKSVLTDFGCDVVAFTMKDINKIYQKDLI